MGRDGTGESTISRVGRWIVGVREGASALWSRKRTDFRSRSEEKVHLACTYHNGKRILFGIWNKEPESQMGRKVGPGKTEITSTR
jgi:hypothetical protein